MDTPTAPAALPAWLHGLVDDAAIFPPGNLPLNAALEAHRGHRASEYADLVGPFVVSDGRLPELCELVEHDQSGDHPPLAINLVVTGGVGAIEGAVTWATRSPAVELKAIEFALRDEDDLAHNAARVVAMADHLGLEVPVFVEPPRVHGEPQPGWLAALDELAARELPLKFRLGGVTADLVPTGTEVAACLKAALDRELPFKCTAGLHHALSHDEGHGFLNVLRATRAELDGEDTEAVLAERDPVILMDGFDADVAQRTRRWFTSFGSCSILEPHDDLVDLGLIETPDTSSGGSA